MNEHTAEPWKYIAMENGGWKIVPASDAEFKICRIENAITYLMDFDEAAEPDARRICAAVNACAGIETETLEDGVTVYSSRTIISDLAECASTGKDRADDAVALLTEARKRLNEIVEAIDSGHAQIASEEVDGDGDNIPDHPWHEEGLHYVRAFLDGAKPQPTAGAFAETLKTIACGHPDNGEPIGGATARELAREILSKAGLGWN